MQPTDELGKVVNFTLV